MWLPTKATVLYDPFRPGIRKIRQAPLIVANVDPNIAEYYRWWVKKRFGLTLQNTAWHPHVTIVNGKVPVEQNDGWKKFHNKQIELEYSVDIEQHWKFWVLPARGKQLTMIRDSLGLPTTHDFHITIGRMY